jgi:hypothetical protein
VDNSEMFSPIVKLTTSLLVFALAAMKHWHLHKLDINNIGKLQKSLNGLKVASRQCNTKLTSVLISLDFHQSSDYSLLVMSQNSHINILFIYVDDVVC